MSTTTRRPPGFRAAILVPAIVLAALARIPAADANPFTYAWESPAPGVWAAIRTDPFELPQEGNAVFVVTDEGVVLFDAGGSPKMGEQIVAKVRAVTRQPITDVVLSHWHGDHMRGLQSIRAAFPAARIFAHAGTRERIVATRDRWRKRRETMVPNITKGLHASLDAGHDLSGRPLVPAEKAWLERGLTITDELDRENRATDYVFPDATIDDSLTLYLGGRTIRFFHPGRAHTAGDLVMWLPQDSVVATGDVVTAPVPLMPSPYLREYPAALEAIERLGFRALVPGHGPVLHDAEYLHLLRDTMRSAMDQVGALVAAGTPRDSVAAKLDWSLIEPRYTHGDPFLANRFHDYVADHALPAAAWLAVSRQDPPEDF